MTFAIVGAISIVICWKWGNWRNWSKYYPTILFFIIGDLVEDQLTCDFPLWGYGDLVDRYPILDVVMMFLMYPSTVILFFTWFPKTFGKQCLYISLWVGIYCFIEIVSYQTGGFCYHNGWNIWYSMLFNAAMFPLLALHHKKPLAVWPISAALCFALLWWFRVPLAK